MVLIVDIGTGNGTVRWGLNTRAPSFLSHVKIGMVKREGVERED